MEISPKKSSAQTQRDSYLEMKRQDNPNVSFIPLNDLLKAVELSCVSQTDSITNRERAVEYKDYDNQNLPAQQNTPNDDFKQNSTSSRSFSFLQATRSSRHFVEAQAYKTPYECITQHEETLDALFVGVFKGTIALWESGSIINWIARMDGYPTKQHAMEAATALFKATTRWNQAMDGRVKFQYVTRFDDACFQLIYSGNRGNVLASAFFPDQYKNALNSLKIYDAQFLPQHKPFIVNTFLHELGHILGLRHEHSHSGVPGWIPPEDRSNGAESVVWGVKNPKSVMAYYKGQDIQQSDVISIRKAYDELSDGKIIYGQGRFEMIQKTISRVIPNN